MELGAIVGKWHRRELEVANCKPDFRVSYTSGPSEHSILCIRNGGPSKGPPFEHLLKRLKNIDKLYITAKMAETFPKNYIDVRDYLDVLLHDRPEVRDLLRTKVVWGEEPPVGNEGTHSNVETVIRYCLESLVRLKIMSVGKVIVSLSNYKSRNPDDNLERFLEKSPSIWVKNGDIYETTIKV